VRRAPASFGRLYSHGRRAERPPVGRARVGTVGFSHQDEVNAWRKQRERRNHFSAVGPAVRFAERSWTMQDEEPTPNSFRGRPTIPAGAAEVVRPAEGFDAESAPEEKRPDEIPIGIPTRS
jgi:hypothetical protein